MATLWIVRAGRGGVDAPRWLESGSVEVAFGSPTIGARAIGLKRDKLVAEMRAALPDRKEGQVFNHASQLFRFNEEVKPEDEVVTYDPEPRRYYLGKVLGPTTFEGETDVGEARYRKQVRWLSRIDRDALSVETRNTLGSTLTIFRPNEEAAGELRRSAVAIESPEPREPMPPKADKELERNDVTRLGEDLVQKSKEFIKDRIAKIDWEEMQDLVAGLLRAMGYKATVVPPGPDGGHDIFASPDGLGLQEPRIFVEVKHRPGTSIGAPLIRSFLGGRRPGDRCLYVSTGGFTKDARSEALRASVPIHLVDLAQLASLLEEYYEKLEPQDKQIVPLRRLYWPD
jgi:restriction system protein